MENVGVCGKEFTVAAAQSEDALKQALAEARERSIAWQRAGMSADFEIDTAPGVRCGRVVRPIARVGLYVPAGSAPLPSTALMLGVPARLAGCAEVVLRSEEHTPELQSLMRTSYAVFCLKKKI